MRDRIVFVLLLACVMILPVVVLSQATALIQVAVPIGEISGRVFMVLITILNIAVIFILYNRDDPRDFSVDRGSIVLLLLSGIFRPRLFVDGEVAFGLINAILLIVLIFLTAREWTRIPRVNYYWVGWALLLSFFSFPISWFGSQIRGPFESLSVFNVLDLEWFIWYFLEVVSKNTVWEEFVFRGLLTGYLIRFGFGEIRAYWIQGVIFVFIHAASYLNRPFEWLVVIPFTTVLLTALLWKSKQLLPLIILHTGLNIGTFLFYYYYWP